MSQLLLGQVGKTNDCLSNDDPSKLLQLVKIFELVLQLCGPEQH